MDFEFVIIMIFLIIFMSIEITLNKILRELKEIRIKFDKIEEKKWRNYGE